MHLLTLPRLIECWRISCGALLIFASFQLLPQTHEKEHLMKYPTFYRTNTDSRALDFLQRGRPERRADASPAARTSVIIADVRAALRPAFRSLSPCRARLPRLWTQRLAGPEKIRVYVRSLCRDHESLHRSARAFALHALHAGLRRPGGFS